MIAFPDQGQFQRPASKRLIAFSLLFALLFNSIPWTGLGLILRPDFVALLLIYWCIHQPHRVSIGVAWLVGIFSDVAGGSLFGQHALAYVGLAFICGLLYRRMQMLNLFQQMLQIFPVLLVTYALYGAVHWQVRGYVEWIWFLGCVTTMLLWIPLSMIMRALRQQRSDSNTL